MSIEQSICNAVDIIVDRAISQAGFDKTISAVVLECVDEIVGKYKVKYQDSIYYATSDNASVTYNPNTEVYILVPGNDFSREKKILGTVKTLGANYITSAEGDEAYEYIGTNCIEPHDALSLCSYKNNSIKIYDVNNQATSKVKVDTDAVKEYLSQSTHIIAGAKFKTQIDKEQRNYGDFGIIFGLRFVDDGTKEPVIKECIVNVDNMTGQPYNYSTYSRQVEEFEINSENFVQLEYITIFADKFLLQDSKKPDDIWLTDIEFNGAIQLNAAELDSYYLSLITPNGTFFPKSVTQDSLSLKGEIKIRGKVIDNDLHRLAFYWFVEHAGVDSKHPYYCKYGGQGWKCLNDFNTIEGAFDDNGNAISSTKIEWVPAGDTYIINKKDNLAFKTNYKCVCIYNDEIILSKEIVIKNYSAAYNIEIISSNGVQFSYDQGATTLTCKVDNLQNFSYNYYWSEINNVGNYSRIETTTEENQRYDLLSSLQKELKQALSYESRIKNKPYTTMGSKYTAVENYIKVYISQNNPTNEQFYNGVVNYLSDTTITRVKDNVIHNLLAKTITNYSTYSCAVHKVENNQETYIGNASIKILNSFDNQPSYTLTIHNGSQVFKYNENGLSPSHDSNENPIKPATLSFSLFDETGNRIADEVIQRNAKVYWSIPTKETLLVANILADEGEKIVEEDKTIFTNSLIFDYNLNPSYSPNKTNNDIELKVVYKNKTFIAMTNFTFLKEGESGTNGTNYACRIVPNMRNASDIVPKIPVLSFHNYSSGTTKPATMNYVIKGSGNTGTNDARTYKNWFKVELWEDAEKIFDGYSSSGDFTVEWEVLANNYGNNGGTDYKDNTIFTVSNSGSFGVGNYSNGTNNPANIIKATITYQGKRYTATIPIVTVLLTNSQYQLTFKEGSGYNFVTYNSDGTQPKYDALSPFEVELLYKDGDTWVDISTSTSYKPPTYTWSTSGAVYTYNGSKKAWVLANLLKEYSVSNVAKNAHKYAPAAAYDGQCVNVGIEVIAKVDGSEVARVHKPIHFLLNRYGLAALNDWDGNSIKLNEDTGSILSPQVGAGKKNSDNSFTGVLMGTVDDPNDTTQKTGLLGYTSGQRSIFLDAETGKAEFGVNGKGKIVLDPSSDRAQLYSGNYSTTNKTGMLIDLTTPEIKYGSGNFSVNASGELTAKGGGSIAGWTIGTDKLYKGNVGISSNNSDDNQYAFWAGATSGGNASFKVTFGGELTAKKGTVGGWTIDDKNIYTGSLTLIPSSVPAVGSARLSKTTFSAKISGKESDAWRFNIGSKFGVTNDGSLYCNSGTIGGWTLNDYKITGGGENGVKVAVMQVPRSDISWVFAAGGASHSSYGDCPFRVHKDGRLWATSATISGSVTITSGSISIGNVFNVNSSGYLTATGATLNSATVTGTIYANAGQIGGCSIVNGQLRIGAANISNLSITDLTYNGTKIAPGSFFALTGVSLNYSSTGYYMGSAFEDVEIQGTTYKLFTGVVMHHPASGVRTKGRSVTVLAASSEYDS